LKKSIYKKIISPRVFFEGKFYLITSAAATAGGIVKTVNYFVEGIGNTAEGAAEKVLTASAVVSN
jgi:hypothetical protein